MKKLIIYFSGFVIFLIICFIVISVFFEEKIIIAFRNQIIDKSSLNVDFSSIHFSLVKNFPYGSFILNDVNIFYSKKDRNDTLIHSKKLNIKVNTLKLLKNIYDFPEIKASDATINIKADKFEQLFSESNLNDNTYLIKTKRIRLINCYLIYSNEESNKVKCFINNSLIKGVFSNNYLSAILNLKISNIETKINGFIYKNNGPINFETELVGKNEEFLTKYGICKINSIPLDFSFFYSAKSNDVKFQIKGNEIHTNLLSEQIEILKGINAIKGKVSINAIYSVNLKSTNLNSQKLTIYYRLSNVHFEKLNDFFIINLNGSSSFVGDFSSNESEIKDFILSYSGIKLIGSAKLKGLPNPYILIESKVSTIENETKIGDSIFIQGGFSGNLKLLLKINDINNLNIRTLKILNLNSSFLIPRLTFSKNKSIIIGPGELKINENNFKYLGQINIYQTLIKGSINVPRFFDVISKKRKPQVYLTFECNKMNFDSLMLIQSKKSKTSFQSDLFLNGKIDRIEYNGYRFSDCLINLDYSNGNIVCNSFSSKFTTGEVFGNFNFSNDNIFELNLNMNNLEIKDVFKCFKDFNQNYISYKNVSGLISGNTHLSFKQDFQNTLDLLSINLFSNIIIEKGSLCGVGYMNKLSNYMNINELDTIRFHTIKNKIEITRGKITIPKMDIASNSINFTISGEHNFSGAYTYWLKLNLNDILVKKYHLNKKPNYEQDNNGGINVFLKFSGNNDSYNISIDKTGTLKSLKSNFQHEGIILKSLIKEEFSSKKRDSSTNSNSGFKKDDTLNNKIQKNSFKIEWDEIDSTKINNN